MEAYLDRCLMSLIVPDELVSGLEVLVINDGSKDKSSEIAHGYEARYPQTFRIIDKENGNYGSCINRGLTQAKGKYIKVLDADDWFETENFAEFLTLLQEINVDCVMSDMRQVDEQGVEHLIYGYSLPKDSVSYLHDVTNRLTNEVLWMHCVTYRTDNLKKIHYHQTEGISYTDQEWLFLPMSTCTTIYYFPKIVYNYLVGRDGQTMNPDVFRKNFWQEIKGVEAMAEEMGNIVESQTDTYNYLFHRLLGRGVCTYGAFFENYRMAMWHDEMVKLDNHLRSHTPKVYLEMGRMSNVLRLKNQGLKAPRSWFFFIALWRKRNFPHSMLLLKIWLWLKSRR